MNNSAFDLSHTKKHNGDPPYQRVAGGNNPLCRLYAYERAVLDLLVERRGQAVSTFELMDCIGPYYTLNTLRVAIFGIRQVIHGRITTIRGYGYRYEDDRPAPA